MEQNTCELINAVDAAFDKFIWNPKSYHHSGLTLDKTCRMLNISKRDIRLYIKYTHGFNSFSYLINWYRVADAVDFWKENEELALRDIAQRVGFRSWVHLVFWFILIRR